MNKNILLTLLVLSLSSCNHVENTKVALTTEVKSNNNFNFTIIGSMVGGDLVGGIFVEFDFNKDKTYEQRTYSINDVLIGAHLGTYDVEANVINLHQKREYVYSNEKHTGEWTDFVRELKYPYVINGITITVSVSGFSFEMMKNRKHN